MLQCWIEACRRGDGAVAASRADKTVRSESSSSRQRITVTAGFVRSLSVAAAADAAQVLTPSQGTCEGLNPAGGLTGSQWQRSRSATSAFLLVLLSVFVAVQVKSVMRVCWDVFLLFDYLVNSS